MNHNDRLLFNRLIKQSNGLLVIAIITLLSILIGVVFPNPYSYNIAVSGFAIALIWGLIRNYKNKKTYTEDFSTYYDIIKKGNRLYFEAKIDDPKLAEIHGYRIDGESSSDYFLRDSTIKHNKYILVPKSRVIEDSNRLPEIEAQLQEYPQYFE